MSVIVYWYVLCLIVRLQAGKLSEDDRKQTVDPLLQNGWSMVNNRDAIYKEYMFKNFNQVLNIQGYYNL